MITVHWLTTDVGLFLVEELENLFVIKYYRDVRITDNYPFQTSCIRKIRHNHIKINLCLFKINLGTQVVPFYIAGLKSIFEGWETTRRCEKGKQPVGSLDKLKYKLN